MRGFYPKFLKEIARRRVKEAKEEKKPDIFEPEWIYKKGIRTSIEDEEFEKDKKLTVTKLIEFLKRPTAEVRLYNRGFLHGKVYIFDKLAILGSSNLTYFHI